MTAASARRPAGCCGSACPTATTVVHDVVRGDVEFDHDAIEDFVLLRGNGTPVFVLANVVDDIEMGITHVVRGDEHLPNTPKQQLLWQALGHEPPVWAHVPVLVNEARKKLSKRRDKVALEQYRDEGYVADAMVNYLMTLGWAPKGDTEIVPWERIEEEFRLEDVTHSPAFFDLKKLAAFNGEYIRAMSAEEFVAACDPWIPDGWDDRAASPRIAPLLQSARRHARRRRADGRVPVRRRAGDRRGVVGQGDEARLGGEAARRGHRHVRARRRGSTTPCTREWKRIADELGVKYRLADGPVRVAVSGRSVGPPLFESLELLGRDETLRRLRSAEGTGAGCRPCRHADRPTPPPSPLIRPIPEGTPSGRRRRWLAADRGCGPRRWRARLPRRQLRPGVVDGTQRPGPARSTPSS